MKSVILLVIITFSASSFAVSFNCKKASNIVENAICSDPLLGKMDAILADNYKGMLNSDFGGSTKSLKNEQKKWISSRNKCKNRQCIIDAYRKRIDETCEYGVVSGVHPDCTMSDDIQ